MTTARFRLLNEHGFCGFPPSTSVVVARPVPVTSRLEPEAVAARQAEQALSRQAAAPVCDRGLGLLEFSDDGALTIAGAPIGSIRHVPDPGGSWLLDIYETEGAAAVMQRFGTQAAARLRAIELLADMTEVRPPPPRRRRRVWFPSAPRQDPPISGAALHG